MPYKKSTKRRHCYETVRTYYLEGGCYPVGTRCYLRFPVASEREQRLHHRRAAALSWLRQGAYRRVCDFLHPVHLRYVCGGRNREQALRGQEQAWWTEKKGKIITRSSAHISGKSFPQRFSMLGGLFYL